MDALKYIIIDPVKYSHSKECVLHKYIKLILFGVRDSACYPYYSSFNKQDRLKLSSLISFLLAILE